MLFLIDFGSFSLNCLSIEKLCNENNSSIPKKKNLDLGISNILVPDLSITISW